MPRACTLIGCDSALRVEFPDPLPEGATITLEPVDPDGQAVSFTCTATSPCESLLVARDFTPDALTVRIQGGGVDHVEAFTPDYTVSRPNGPDCPPECRHATIFVDPR